MEIKDIGGGAVNYGKVKTDLTFKKDDRVEWFEDRYTTIKSYGKIIRINKTTAKVRDQFGYETLVKLSDLNWGPSGLLL